MTNWWKTITKKPNLWIFPRKEGLKTGGIWNILPSLAKGNSSGATQTGRASAARHQCHIHSLPHRHQCWLLRLQCCHQKAIAFAFLSPTRRHSSLHPTEDDGQRTLAMGKNPNTTTRPILRQAGAAIRPIPVGCHHNLLNACSRAALPFSTMPSMRSYLRDN
jgi:hypothetical protein